MNRWDSSVLSHRILLWPLVCLGAARANTPGLHQYSALRALGQPACVRPACSTMVEPGNADAELAFLDELNAAEPKRAAAEDGAAAQAPPEPAAEAAPIPDDDAMAFLFELAGTTPEAEAETKALAARAKAEEEEEAAAKSRDAAGPSKRAFQAEHDSMAASEASASEAGVSQAQTATMLFPIVACIVPANCRLGALLMCAQTTNCRGGPALCPFSWRVTGTHTVTCTCKRIESMFDHPPS